MSDKQVLPNQRPKRRGCCSNSSWIRSRLFLWPLSLLAVFCSLPVCAEQGDDSALLQHRSLHAYQSVFGLPTVAARPVQSREWQLTLEHSNQFMGGKNGEEHLLLDGETTELTFHHRQRLAPCWQGALALPFIHHGPGMFDHAIDRWHQFFGLPNAERDSHPFNDFYYGYSDASGSAVTIDSPQSGIGDIRLSVQRSLGCQATADATSSQAIARFGIKLPTGAADELLGSGKVDIYGDIQSPVWTQGSRWQAGASLGLLLVGQSRHLAPQRTFVAFGALGTQFRLSQRYRLMLQVDWHTPFYDSGLHELGDPGVILVVGLRYLAAHDQTLELTISEDAAIDTAPDIVARLAWTYRPTAGR
jgi:hypothetical protein